MNRYRLTALVLSGIVVGALGAVVIGEAFDGDDPEIEVVAMPESIPADTAESTTAPPASSVVAPTEDVTQVDPVEAEQAISAAQAIEIAEAAAGGEAIDVDRGSEEGRSVFYVDVITADGPVEVYVDVQTGEVIEVRDGP